MSKPTPPYYHKEESSDVYYWDVYCSKNHYPASGWKKQTLNPEENNATSVRKSSAFKGFLYVFARC